MKDRSQIGRAEEWEVTDQELGGVNGPWRARRSREENRKPLLAGYEILVDGELDNLPRPVFNDLLARVGARRVHSIASFSFTPGITRLIITNSVQTYGVQAAIKRLRRERLAVVEKEWLLDTISGHSLRPLINYVADAISEKQLLGAGYSRLLVVPQEN